MAHAERIQQEIEAAEREKVAAEREHATLALQLVDTPGSKKLGAELASFERIIDEHQRRINRLRVALEEARRQGTAAAKAQRAKLLRETLQRVQADHAAEITAAAAELEQSLNAISPAVVRFTAALRRRASDAHAVLAQSITVAGEADLRAKSAAAQTLERAFADGAVVEALARAIANCGVPLLPVRPYVTVIEPSALSVKVALRDAIEHQNKRVAALLQRHAERAIAELTPAKREVA
jgi:hypothetical protein